MDHLILPEGVEPYITVPYKCIVPYETGDFLSYPQRKGWTQKHLCGDEDFGGRSPAEVEAFFQTWLYFGMLLEVLKAAGVQATTEDFIDRGAEVVVTTKKLPELLREWKKRWPKPEVSPDCMCEKYPNPAENFCDKEPCWKNVVHLSDSEARHTTKAILDWVCWFVDRYCGTEGRENVVKQTATPLPAPKAWPVAPEIAISISALGYTLRAAAHDIYDTPLELNRWGGALLLKDRLLKANWCPAHVAITMTDLGIDGRYYVAANPQKEKEDHSACQETACAAKGLNEKLYITKHVTEDCGCKHAEPLEADLLGIIGRRATPILTWAGRGGNSGYQLTVTEFRVSIPRLPVVELDATGQPVLPMPTPTPAKYVAISHVWSDGMGNPKHNSLPVCQLTRIQQMVDELNFPGRGTDEHVPFWIDTLCVPVRHKHKQFRKLCIVNMRNIYEQAAAVLVLDSGLQKIPLSAPAPERCIRVHQSIWQRRLWTFQEGFLAPELYYRFSDRSEYFRDLVNDSRKYEDDLQAQGQYISFTRWAEGKASAHFTLVKALIWRIKTGAQDESSRFLVFLPLTEALRPRKTSRASDETLCAATILGIDPTPFLELQEKDDQSLWSWFASLWSKSADIGQKQLADQRLADRRMELFLQFIGQFPSGIIFNRLPRLQRDGYRWAPRSLMGGRPNDIGDLSAQGQYGQMCKSGEFVGLSVRYPGFRLGTVASHFGIRIVVADGDARYDVQLSPDENGAYPVWEGKLQYCLVMARAPSELNADGSLAILGSRNQRNGFELRYECRAWVELLMEEVDGDVLGEPLAAETFWVIK